uniref:Lysozyme g n=1 Tax=Oncorhynchus kisutch TaxID=8019 RepID=A0A8C7CHG0_ONCKI
NRYGDIRKVDTTGASWATANADGKSSIPLRANHRVFGNNRPYVDKYKGRITNAGQRYGVDRAVLGGIISRGSVPNAGCRDVICTPIIVIWLLNFKRFFFTHCATASQEHCHRPQGAWVSQEHIEQDAQIVAPIQILTGPKRALADYNMGPGNISSYEEVDAKTTGGDYSNQINV